MLSSEPIHLAAKLENFYGAWAIFIPDDVFGAMTRALVTGSINLHDFEGIAEPWREARHVLVLPQPIFRELWVNEGQMIDLAFRFSLSIPKPDLPASLRRTLYENPDYAQAFAGMSDSDQRQYTFWIASAPSKGVQEHRIEATIAHVRDLLQLPVKMSVSLPRHSPDIIPDNFRL